MRRHVIPVVVWAGVAVAAAAPATVPASPGACAALSSAASADLAFDEAPSIVPAGQAVTGGVGLPAHCLVRGTLEKRIGVEGIPFGSKFELRLPLQWNGRFMFQGGGGTDGAVLPALGDRNQPVGIPPALAEGWAVVTTDGGHEDKDSSFGLDPKARTDWGYHSADIVTQTAKRLIGQFYGRAPDRSYLVGCSNGGRQGMMMSQRFPDEYDGIVAGDPVFRLSASHVASAWDIQTFSAIAPRTPSGAPLLSAAFSDADLALVSAGILGACDMDDGVRDGRVGDPGTCRFDPAALQCPGGKTTSCLSAPQVGALRRYIAGPADSAGRPLYTGWPWDPGFASPDWRAWKLGTSETDVPNAIKAGLSNNAIRYVFLTPPQPDMTEAAFDFDHDPARMNASASFADATSTDLQAFRAHGGKMIFYHGTADPAISAFDTVRYYKDLLQVQGGTAATASFARLFLVPGMTHCRGGGGLDSFDPLAAIVAWVEHGAPPDRLIATGKARPGLSRPLCPYPLTSHYAGRGPADDAESFSCR